NIRDMAVLPVPIIVVVTGEGGSGGALAIGVGDVVLMLEHAIYSVISPEGCASILWRDAKYAPDAAEALKLTAPDLLELGVIDEIIPEPPGGAHRDLKLTAERIKKAIKKHYSRLKKVSPDKLIRKRIEKYGKMGIYKEE
ncbi:acetyl-CoA carboxylase carboxyl transferase subunit alpha, partial [bacterium]